MSQWADFLCPLPLNEPIDVVQHTNAPPNPSLYSEKVRGICKGEAIASLPDLSSHPQNSFHQSKSTLSFKHSSCNHSHHACRRRKSTPKSIPKPLEPWSMCSLCHETVSDLHEEHDLFFDFHRQRMKPSTGS